MSVVTIKSVWPVFGANHINDPIFTYFDEPRWTFDVTVQFQKHQHLNGIINSNVVLKLRRSQMIWFRNFK